MLKITYNDITFDYYVWEHPTKEIYFVDLRDETRIPIEVVKDELEKLYDVKIQSYCETGYKRYAKDNYAESKEFSYYFSTKMPA